MKKCKWAAKKPGKRCRKKSNGTKVKILCPAACNNCPAGAPTTAPVNPTTIAPVNLTTNAPGNLPTSAPVNTPTSAPVSNSNGCCSLDYKNCIDWCGSTYDSCVNCSNQDVDWLSDGAAPSTCGERWTGCGENNDAAHSGCCSGLTCQMRTGDNYMACLPGDDNNPVSPTPPPTTAPQPSPTANPVSQPTPVSPAVSPPTNGGGGDLKTGKATFYGGNPSGNACGYNDLPQVTFPKGFSVAIGGDEFDDGYGCGACYEVTCMGSYGNNPNCFCGNSNQKTVIVQATDQCPECDSTHFDLNTEAFTSIVKDQSSSMAGTCGILETQFRRVSCDFESNIKMRSKSGTSGWWYGLHIDDVAGYGAIKSIELRESGRRQNGQNSFDIVCDKSQGPSFWICNRPNGREIFAPLDVQLTDSAGRNLQRNNVITNLEGGQEFDFRTNFGPMDGGDPSPTSPTSPVSPPTSAPTKASPPTTSFSGELISTDQAMNAWEVFQGLDYITHKNPVSPPDLYNYAVVASGGAAGDGTLVVSESQAYGLLITGAVLASWDTHAGEVSGSDRSEVLKYFEGYYSFWKNMCKTSSNKGSNCQPSGDYCQSSSGSNVCLPDWRHYKTGGSESTGPAPDADEDGIVGIMLAVKAVENDANKPYWYDEARKWADASATAFFKFNVDKSKGDYRLVKLGSCWGGWDDQGNNPSYHSPGSYRVMKDYQNSFPNSLRVGYDAISQDEWTKLINTSHEVLRAVQCSNDGALVPNWATVGVQNGMIVHTSGRFSGSGTPQYEYGAEAARTTFRVALDAAFYPENSSEWSPYLSQFNYRLDASFQNGSFSSATFPSCLGPNTNQNINMFGGWQSNAFIYGPTYSTLIAASSSIGNAEAMIDAAGSILGNDLPNSYYPRSWAMIGNLMLSGAMESAGSTLRG